jgi:uncharacterized protein (TIGR00369 family)
MKHTIADVLAPAPEGFVPVPIGGAFAALIGPLYGRWHEGRLQLGFRVETKHANPGGSCHGGMLATMADILISSAAFYQADIPRHFLPTISLQFDFMANAPLGCWVQGQADILRVTRNLLFSQGLVYADGELALRASGVFRRGPLQPDTTGDQWLQLPGMPPRPPHSA